MAETFGARSLRFRDSVPKYDYSGVLPIASKSSSWACK
jgi:hypothetical protein